MESSEFHREDGKDFPERTSFIGTRDCVLDDFKTPIEKTYFK